MNSEKPADFDWVSERVRCTTFSTFNELLRLAKRDVLNRNAALTENERSIVDFVIEEKPPRYFSVIANNVERVVRFYLQGDQIEITGDGVSKEGLVVTLTLNNNGDCRLRVNGEGEYLEWQVLRLALENLFFGFHSGRR